MSLVALIRCSQQNDSFPHVSHRVVDRRGVHVDTAVVLGHEAELVGFGLHLHGSFAGHLVAALRSSYLERKQKRNCKEEAWDSFMLITCFSFLLQ